MYVYVYVTKVYIKQPATTFTQSLLVAYLWTKADNIAQTMTIPTTYDARLNTLILVDTFYFNFEFYFDHAIDLIEF